MDAAELRTWPDRAASSWRALEHMQTYQVPIVLGGALAILLGIAYAGLGAVHGDLVPTGREIFLVGFGLTGLVGYLVSRQNPRNGALVAGIAGLALMIVAGGAAGILTGLVVAAGAAWGVLTSL